MLGHEGTLWPRLRGKGIACAMGLKPGTAGGCLVFSKGMASGGREGGKSTSPLTHVAVNALESGRCRCCSASFCSRHPWTRHPPAPASPLPPTPAAQPVGKFCSESCQSPAPSACLPLTSLSHADLFLLRSYAAPRLPYPPAPIPRTSGICVSQYGYYPLVPAEPTLLVHDLRQGHFPSPMPYMFLTM